MPRQIKDNIYCVHPFSYSRIRTREVITAGLSMGGDSPIRLQSMTNTSTKDTTASVEQCIKIAEKGGELVRLTAIDLKEAENLAEIKKGLKKKGWSTPIVADIHFNPRIAYEAARTCDKIRINPGNFIQRFPQGPDPRDVIREKFVPLLDICKEHGTTMRIGVNHGSLHPRMMEEYGDTPLGMVESAIEFMDICIEEDYHDMVFSLKSSNTRVMVQAYRLLVHELIKRDRLYPIHLGVTEAGEGEDGRIKSATGIGSLLADGIGDTIRVSLTEDPEKEIPVAKKLAEYFISEISTPLFPEQNEYPVNPYEYNKRESRAVLDIGGDNHPVVIAAGWNGKGEKPDYIYDPTTQSLKRQGMSYPILNTRNYHAGKKADGPNFLLIDIDQTTDTFQTTNTDQTTDTEPYTGINQAAGTIFNDPTLVLILEGKERYSFYRQRRFISQLIKENNKVPVILKKVYKTTDPEALTLYSAADLGGLLIDGLGDGIWLEATPGTKTPAAMNPSQLSHLSFGILQAARVRTTRTEYISCPSCGRTLFDIQEVTASIREKTRQLKGLKIGIMGCIVNGPGEMADADYGYVGAGPGKISLYKNREVVKKNLPTETAVDELIALIKENGDWTE